MDNPPKVFISYCWEDDEHKEWVRSLADCLIADGIDTTLDQYDLSPGDRLPQFMERKISDADYVLIICTPSYKAKSDHRVGGVGYEGHIISNELFLRHNERKFIPVIRKGSFAEAIPNCLAGKLAIDLSGRSHYEDNYEDLVTTIYGVKRKPPVGSKPTYIHSEMPTNANGEENEPIRILGIIADEVTVPKMDGTRGSALYKIPFRLSKTPSRLWQALFLREWNENLFSTMHRPGIASVSGTKIVLDGTTIEEVRDYHRDSLIKCVNEANRRELQEIEQDKKRKMAQEQKMREHIQTVHSLAEDIKF